MKRLLPLLLLASCKAGSTANNVAADALEAAAPVIETATAAAAGGVNPLLATGAAGFAAVGLAAIIKKLRG